MSCSTSTIAIVCNIITQIIDPAMKLLFGVALLYFLWGVFQFIYNYDDEKGKRTEGKNHLLYGVIGMFIMISAIGIMSILSTFFGA